MVVRLWHNDGMDIDEKYPNFGVGHEYGGGDRCCWCGDNVMKVRTDWVDIQRLRDCLQVQADFLRSFDVEDLGDVPQCSHCGEVSGS